MFYFMPKGDKQIKKYNLTYHVVSLEPEEIERRLRQAYSVLFESILQESNEKQ